MADAKINVIGRYMKYTLKYISEEIPSKRGVYTKTRPKLYEVLNASRKITKILETYLGESDSDTDTLVTEGSASVKKKPQNGKSSMYIDAIRLYRQVLSQIASDDQYEQPESKMLAEYLHRWFEVRIVEFCGRGKSNFRCTMKQYGLMLRALILMFVWCAEQDRLDRHSIGTKFSKEFDKWESSVRETDDGRNQYALPFVAKRFYDGDGAYKVDYSEVYPIVRDLQDAGFTKLFTRDVPEEYRMYDKYFKEDQE
ncbi:MAG: hypothetical protein IKS42_01930 [Oscillospiraceae bacterium]|nr:hypothetical protein [Oscillospiraceae bacterium]